MHKRVSQSPSERTIYSCSLGENCCATTGEAVSDRDEPWSEDPRRRGRRDEADEAFWGDDGRRRGSKDRRRAAEETFFGDGPGESGDSGDSVFNQRTRPQQDPAGPQESAWGQPPDDPYGNRRAPRPDPRQVQAGAPPTRPRPRPRTVPGDDPYRTQAYPTHQQPGAGVRRPPNQRQAQPYGTPRQHPVGRPDQRDPYQYERPPERDREPRGGGLRFPIGLGAVFGVAGLGLFVLALTSLPWAKAGGQEMTLPDIRDAFATVGDAPEEPAPTTTLPTTLPDGGISTPGEVQDAVEDQVRDAATEAATNAVDSAKGTYLELYSKTIWMVAIVAVGLAVLFATVLAPSSFALRLILGFQRLGGTVTVLVAILHGAALWVVFSGKPAPTPALGVWAGVAGLVFILVGCVLGPRKS